MIRAALYLMRRSFANGMRRRIARLREPRYVIAFAIGLLYFYWILARPAGARLDRETITGGVNAVTIELILGLRPMSQFDASARTFWRSFTTMPDPTPYEAVRPEQPLDELNPAGRDVKPRRASVSDETRASL